MLASYVKALLHKDGIHWNKNGKVGSRSDMGDGVTITYNFVSELPGYDKFADNFESFTEKHKGDEQLGRGLKHYEAVANIRFREDPNGKGTLRFGYADILEKNVVGLATRPSRSGASIVLEKDYASFSQGTSAYSTWLHELGHAVGGFNDVSIGRDPNHEDVSKHQGIEGKILSQEQDSLKYTIMSYEGHPDMSEVEPRTLGLYDIAAIQALYGANWNYNSGDNIYQHWETNETFIETIWDGGGNDTISAMNQTRRAIIDLRAGHFSSIGSLENGTHDATDNLAIAYGVTIENAVGGSGDDELIGNDADNTLLGGEGKDNLVGGLGDDILSGDEGNDTLVDGLGNDELYGGNNDDTLVTIAGDDKLYGEAGKDLIYVRDFSGKDRLDGGEDYDTLFLLPADGRDLTIRLRTNDVSDGQRGSQRFYNFEEIKSGRGNDRLEGDRHDNILYGGSGNDILTGGAGNDMLFGESGQDFVLVQNFNGTDRFDGGADYDTLYLKPSDARDLTVWLDRNEVGDNRRGSQKFYNFEEIRSGNGNDTLNGDTQDNVLYGAGGNDSITGGAGNDKLYGGAGDDFVRVEDFTGNDRLDGGTGYDTLVLTPSDNRNLIVRLDRNEVEDGRRGSQRFYNFEEIKLGSGDDTIFGDSKDSRLFGGAGNDTIYGGAGNDTVFGGIDDDYLNGTGNTRDARGSGERDILISSSGDSDTFVLGNQDWVFYDAQGNSDYAILQDFSYSRFGGGESVDKIQLHGDATRYSLGSVSLNGIAGAGIHHRGDLIGIVQNVSSASLNLTNPNQFTYV